MAKPDWNALTGEGKAAAIKPLMREGVTFAQIAAMFEGASRNAVAGIVSRRLPDAPRSGLRSSTGPRKPRAPKVPKVKRPWRPKPKAPTPLRSHPPTVGSIRFIDRRPGQCRFPMWDRFDVQTSMVCGAGIEPEATYCEAHRRLCSDGLPQRRKAA